MTATLSLNPWNLESQIPRIPEKMSLDPVEPGSFLGKLSADLADLESCANNLATVSR